MQQNIDVGYEIGTNLRPLSPFSVPSYPASIQGNERRVRHIMKAVSKTLHARKGQVA